MSGNNFLGERGRFNGEDIIDIIVKQPATARFISRHLYNFFVEDEPPVHSWSIEPPRNEDAIQQLSEIFLETSGDMRLMLKFLFNADWFKNSKDKKKVKSPAELVAGVLKQTGEYRNPKPGMHEFSSTVAVMGQNLMNPPTVEGWHTGREWIDSGTLSERVNFAAKQFKDASKPGIQEILQRAGSLDDDPAGLVDRCLDLMGGFAISEETRRSLVEYAKQLDTMESGSDGEDSENQDDQEGADVLNLLQMIVSTVDYQFA